MILQSRKWRLLIRTLTLIITSTLMLAFAAPASYALQDDRPKLITHAEQLYNKELPLAGRYVYTSSLPDLQHIATTQSIATTYYWIPLPEYDNQLLVRVEGNNFLHAYYRTADLNMDARPRTGNFFGKITALTEQADTDKVMENLANQGILVDKENAMVLLQGEEPGTYRPMVPVVGVLAAFWALALVGLLRIWRGGRRSVKRKT